MRVLERNASDGVNPIILIQFGSLHVLNETRIIGRTVAKVKVGRALISDKFPLFEIFGEPFSASQYILHHI